MNSNKVSDMASDTSRKPATEFRLNDQQTEGKSATKQNKVALELIVEECPSKYPSNSRSVKGEDESTFMSNISALTIPMRLFGLYFEVSDTRLQKSGTWFDCLACWNAGRVYSTLVLAVLWLNLIRLTTCFLPHEKWTPSLLFKLSACLFILAINLMLTCYYVACTSGKLNHLFGQIVRYNKEEDEDLAPLANGDDKHFIDNRSIKTTTRPTANTNHNKGKSDEYLHVVCLETYDTTNKANDNILLPSSNDRLNQTRKATITTDISHTFSQRVRFTARVCAFAAWVALFLNMTLTATSLFQNSFLGTSTAPINTYFKVGKEVEQMAELVCFFVYIYVSAAGCFSQAMTFFVFVTLWREFKSFNRRFKVSICGQKFLGDFELYRLRHQRLSHIVEKADKILWLCNGGNITCHLATIVIGLFNMIWFTALLEHPQLLCLLLFYLVFSLSQVGLCSLGAILVNNAVILFFSN